MSRSAKHKKPWVPSDFTTQASRGPGHPHHTCKLLPVHQGSIAGVQFSREVAATVFREYEYHRSEKEVALSEVDCKSATKTDADRELNATRAHPPLLTDPLYYRSQLRPCEELVYKGTGWLHPNAAANARRSVRPRRWHARRRCPAARVSRRGRARHLDDYMWRWSRDLDLRRGGVGIHRRNRWRERHCREM